MQFEPLKRRDFLLGCAAAAWPLAVRAQQPALPVKTAKRLGLEIPPKLLALADEVIE